ncbi:NAD(+)/NADH kinase [Amycolatopsis sp.]|uniref:NAD(+)/NADH kinase n=1 Tax=Amycolatopsis sp. TaxID=37632 RepID=UPI0026137A53|nr:NAD(+)/NADH kinase [Amycolatopsis sp.]
MKLHNPDGKSEISALGLVVHPTKPVDDSVAKIIAWAASHSVQVVAREQDRDRVTPEVETLPDDEFVARVSGLLALGGDGTMLGAMRLVIARPVPVLGINHGNLGFLVEVTPATLEDSLARLIDGDFTIEAHSCLDAEWAGATPSQSVGFNDIVLASTGRAGAVSVDLTVNGLQYGYYKCDALVLSTPSGSTAYNYAAGGPVVSPSASVVVVTPVAPMAGISRAVVLGAEDRISIHVAAESAPVEVDIDGTSAGQLAPDGVLTAYLREDASQVVRFAAGEHASRSRIKLSLLDLPLRRDQLLELIPGDLRTGNDADG